MEKFCSKEECHRVLKDVKKRLGDYRESNGKLYDDIDELEEDIREKEKFISRITRERNKLQEELKTMCDEVEVKKQDVDKLEDANKKQKETSQKFFMKIMADNKALTKHLEEANEKIEVLENDPKLKYNSKENEVMANNVVLEAQIQVLTNLNEEKEIILKRTEYEKKELSEKIQFLESEKEKVALEHVAENSTAKSLEEELCSAGFMSKMFQCNYCENTFTSMLDLKKHVTKIHVYQAKQNLSHLENNVFNQKIGLTSLLFELKKNENILNQKCRCRIKLGSFCRINHAKYSFVKVKSDEFYSNLKNISNKATQCQEIRLVDSIKVDSTSNGAIRKKYLCNECDKEFSKQGQLKKHVKSEHKKTKQESEGFKLKKTMSMVSTNKLSNVETETESDDQFSDFQSSTDDSYSESSDTDSSEAERGEIGSD